MGAKSSKQVIIFNLKRTVLLSIDWLIVSR